MLFPIGVITGGATSTIEVTYVNAVPATSAVQVNELVLSTQVIGSEEALIVFVSSRVISAIVVVFVVAVLSYIFPLTTSLYLIPATILPGVKVTTCAVPAKLVVVGVRVVKAVPAFLAVSVMTLPTTLVV